jgi:thiol:disulfide interchange protein DsbD
MVPGLWGAPCKAISAFTPPMSTQHWNIYADDDSKESKGTIENPYRDFQEGLEAAKAEGKPVMIDFTGYGCVNCRKMEAAVWTDAEVKSIINDDYVLIQLFVDDKTQLPQPIKVTENGQTRTLRTIGDKWSYFQRTQFGHNTQPFYVLLDPRSPLDGKDQTLRHNILQEPRSYDEDIPAYIRFLRSGISTYQSR